MSGSNPFYPVELDCMYYDIDWDELLADLGQITNSLELKTQVDSTELVGFIHTGSEYFPKMIHERWSKVAVDYIDIFVNWGLKW